MGNLAKKDDNVKTIKTNQSLVHIKHSITIRQYKYWHLLLKFFAEKIEQGVQPDSNGFYFESRARIASYIGYDQMTKELKSDIEALRKESIIINYLEKDGKPAIHGMGFISEYKITSNQIGYRLPSFIESVVRGDDQSKKMFLSLNWEIFNSFSGKYEAIIYKLCKDYIGVGRTPYFALDEYRDYVGLKKDEYREFKRLNEWVIKKPLLAIKVNEDCDITVKVEYTKVGRSVVGLYFSMEYKKQGKLPFKEFQPISAFSFAQVSISPDRQSKFLEMYSEDQIMAIIERANEYIAQLRDNGKPVNMGAIYNKAFSDNWGQEKLIEKQHEKFAEEKRKQEEDQRKQRDEERLFLNNKKIQEEEELHALFHSFDESIKSMLIEKMLDKIKPVKIMFDKFKLEYQDHGTNIKQHSIAFQGHLLEEIKAYKASINS